MGGYISSRNIGFFYPLDFYLGVISYLKAFLNMFFSSSSDESCDEEDDELLPKDPGT